MERDGGQSRLACPAAEQHFRYPVATGSEPVSTGRQQAGRQPAGPSTGEVSSHRGPGQSGTGDSSRITLTEPVNAHHPPCPHHWLVLARQHAVPVGQRCYCCWCMAGPAPGARGCCQPAQRRQRRLRQVGALIAASGCSGGAGGWWGGQREWVTASRAGELLNVQCTWQKDSGEQSRPPP